MKDENQNYFLKRKMVMQSDLKHFNKDEKQKEK